MDNLSSSWNGSKVMDHLEVINPNLMPDEINEEDESYSMASDNMLSDK
jgi:hypothetical protein